MDSGFEANSALNCHSRVGGNPSSSCPSPNNCLPCLPKPILAVRREPDNLGQRHCPRGVMDNAPASGAGNTGSIPVGGNLNSVLNISGGNKWPGSESIQTNSTWRHTIDFGMKKHDYSWNLIQYRKKSLNQTVPKFGFMTLQNTARFGASWSVSNESLRNISKVALSNQSIGSK